MTVRPSPIREALEKNDILRCSFDEWWEGCARRAAALVHLDALEAVADALGRAPALILTVEEYERWYIEDCYPALARLVAVQDGQTERGKLPQEPVAGSAVDAQGNGERAEIATTPARTSPAPRSVCPCKVHGDPDGDCGERCA